MEDHSDEPAAPDREQTATTPAAHPPFPSTGPTPMQQAAIYIREPLANDRYTISTNEPEAACRE